MRYETIYASQFLVHRLSGVRAVRDIRDDGDIVVLDLTTGQKVMILLIERMMSLGDVRHYYQENTARGLYTLMMVWADVFLPPDGGLYELDNWMQILVSLHGEHLYGYVVEGRSAYFFPVYMRGNSRKRRVRYGDVVRYATIGGEVVRTLNPHMPGTWYVGGFGYTDHGYQTPTGQKGQANSVLLEQYDVLGVAHYADIETVKRAYRALARRYHPDINTSADADQRMKRINRAYSRIIQQFEE